MGTPTLLRCHASRTLEMSTTEDLRKGRGVLKTPEVVVVVFTEEEAVAVEVEGSAEVEGAAVAVAVSEVTRFCSLGAAADCSFGGSLFLGASTRLSVLCAHHMCR